MLLRRRLSGLAALLLLGTAGACSSAHPTATPARPGTCLDVATPTASPGSGTAQGSSRVAGSLSAGSGASAASSAARAPVVGPGGGKQFAPVSLPCLNGSGDVRLAGFARPTIITLWASWCPPCRAELPAISSFATANAAWVRVIGVDTADTRTAGTSMAADFGLSFPSVFDADRKVLLGVDRVNLPVTLFVGAGGQVRAVWDVAGLDAAHLATWSRQYLGVEAVS
jgi:cytochrome c biogenesis protein CcmG, thiol:disulfide interchange protein DsbE